MQEQNISRKKLRDKWLIKIKAAEKKYADYYDLVDEIREYYRNDLNCNKQNIFWSSIETLKPFLYFKQPRPFVIRTNKVADKVETLAVSILERALAWNMKQFDFDSVIKYARNDFLLSGMGVLWEQYKVAFKDIGAVTLKDKEVVVTDYINPTSFLADTENVDVWEDVEWIARKSYLSIDNALEYFDQKVADYFSNRFSDFDQTITIYEIWDKKNECIYYLSPEYEADFLRIYKDTLHLSGFFPCPKPIMSTLANNGIIPVPDYVEIKSLLDELDGVNSRMRLIMQSLKVSGCYDSSFPELANILDKDVTLISLSDFDKLKEAGGIRGVIDFAPIEQYINALSVLAERRQVLTNAIYEVTGVSDIMRGTSNERDTATAVTQKTNFGTLRNQDRQNDMQRFIKDLLRIKAEIICEHFSPEILKSFLNAEERQDMPLVHRAINLLKNDKLRDMTIEIETDCSFDPEKDEKRILTVLHNINEMINIAFNIVSKQPALLPLYRQMIESAVATMPNARQFEAVLENTFHKVDASLNAPEEPAPLPVDPLIQMQTTKNNQDYAIKKEQNEIKREELNLKKIAELNKINNQNKKENENAI